MTKINDLSTIDTLTSSDKLIVWNGATRAITAQNLATYVDSILPSLDKVATYAALTAVLPENRIDGQVVYVAGRFNEGDGADGWFRFEAFSSDAANGGTILAPDAGSGRWLRQYSGALNVLWFGFAADGLKSSAAANTVALQAALNANYWVMLPEGTAYIRQITHTQANRLTGVGIGKTVLILDDNQNTRAFYASSLSAIVYEDFTLDMNYANNTGSGAHDGIRLETCTEPVLCRVRVTGAQGLFLGSPVGGGISISAGSRSVLKDCEADACYDGIQFSAVTDARSFRSYVTSNLRNGIVVSSASNRFQQYDTLADGNSTTYAGAGVLIGDSANCQSFGGHYRNSTLGHGLQHNGADYCETFGGVYTGNGISGLDFFDSLYGKVYGGIASDNSVRGLEIDSASNGGLVYGFSGFSNGDVDVSVFRSVNVAIRDISASARVWDAGVLNASGHTISSAGSGYTDGTYTVTIVGGTFLTAGQLSVVVSGGVVTSIASVVNAGNYWTLPANPVSVTGLVGGSGATFNLDWAGDNSGTCADFEAHGGMDGETLLVVHGSSADARISNIRGTVTDTGTHIISAVACDAFSVPFKNASLQNGWLTATRAIYYKDADGVVHIEGRIDSGTVAPNTLIFTLDAGFRPANTEYFLLPVSGGTGLVYVGTDGTVRDLGGTLNATWSSLNSISFRAV